MSIQFNKDSIVRGCWDVENFILKKLKELSPRIRIDELHTSLPLCCWNITSCYQIDKRFNFLIEYL